MPFEEPFELQQRIFKDVSASFQVSCFSQAELTTKIVHDFLETVVDGKLGMAPLKGRKSILQVLALASPSQVLIIRLQPTKAGPPARRGRASERLLEDMIFCNDSYVKYALKMDELSLLLFLDSGCFLTTAVDMLSFSDAARESSKAIMDAFGEQLLLSKRDLFSILRYEDSDPWVDLAQLAWSVCHAACSNRIRTDIRYISTKDLKPQLLELLSVTFRHSNRLYALKPSRIKNDIAPLSISQSSKNSHFVSTRFKTRLRSDKIQPRRIEIITDKNKKITGHAVRTNGRSTELALSSAVHGNIESVTTIGKEEATQAEVRKTEIILMSLTRSITLLGNRFVKDIWFSGARGRLRSSRSSMPISFSSRPLNSSQKKALRAILSECERDRTMLIQGPPGTGKTTVIAAAVTSIVSASQHTIWLVAQSNVAVKNIAEKLASVDFLDFKILVSKEFHYDWHEHLYERLHSSFITSDQFPTDITAANTRLSGSRVTLCTLGMFSNDKIQHIALLVPPQIVIFDEASQIEVGNYLSVLHQYRSTLKKLVFIGDDKQLAPHGQSDIPDLKSIFEMKHLRKRAIFLDTQYRMPEVIGNFISKHVYDGRLQTIHSIKSHSCCKFINVVNGKEEANGVSKVNREEVKIVTNIARHLHAQRKSYRILTPYDAQRSALENALKSDNIPWEGKCFNIDAFQGNEDDYIVISVVRTEKMGFLKEVRRVNVMLTRCKKSMIICTNRPFIDGFASDSLLGALSAELGQEGWYDGKAAINGQLVF